MTDGYMGPGIWIRIQHRFGPRMMEWFMAGHMILFGCILLLPTETFNQPAWASFRYLFHSEQVLGWTMFIVGVLRIIGLIINGAKRRSPRKSGRYPPASAALSGQASHTDLLPRMSSRHGSPSIRCLRSAS